MNRLHLEYCGGPDWGRLVRESIVPSVTAGHDLGDHLLEVGPGPGLTTDVLREMVPALTAVEADEGLAAALSARLQDTNVTVCHANGTRLPFADGTFSAAICLTMLHHVPTREQQDQLFAEMARVVRPGGVVLGSDNLDSPQFREGHIDDVCNPIDPAELPARLAGIGLQDVTVQRNPFAFRFAIKLPGGRS
jgi:ubiquinone/menaquinone biosynthesis C-methylase UbiE